MLRIILAILLVAAVGGLAYFFTHSTIAARTPSASAESVPSSSTPNTTTWQPLPKSTEPAAEGPQVNPPQDVSTLPGPEPNLPPATPGAAADPSIPGEAAPNVKSMPAPSVPAKLTALTDSTAT